MALKDAFIGELKYEASLTQKMLERVPIDKKEWKPHEKSFTLGRLATHIAKYHNGYHASLLLMILILQLSLLAGILLNQRKSC
jgi:hypothetical protein